MGNLYVATSAALANAAQEALRAQVAPPSFASQTTTLQGVELLYGADPSSTGVGSAGG